MTEIFRKFNVFRDIPLKITQNIKSFSVFRDDSNTEVVYCVTKEDKVYAFGQQISERTGYGKSDEKKVELTELWKQNIQQFYRGGYCGKFILAINEQHQIFSWGINNCGQLARGYISKTDEYLKPNKIDFFDGKHIIEVSCADYYCLALSINGRIYGWGNKKMRDTSSSNEDEFILTPIEIDLNTKIRFIHSTNNCSFVLSTDKDVYYCGDINLKDEATKLISKLFKTNNTDSNVSLLHFPPSDNQYQNNENSNDNVGVKWKRFCNLILIKVLFPNYGKIFEMVDLCYYKNRLILQTKDGVYVHKELTFEKTSYQTFNEYFLFEYKMTYKTIQLRDNRLFVIEFEKIQSSEIFSRTFEEIFVNGFKMDEENLILRKFRILNDLLLMAESGVKYFYQSGSDQFDYFGIFVMNDNRVYALGQNKYCRLALDRVKRVYEYIEISELRGQNIVEIYGGEGSCFMIARSEQNHLFAWGWNRLRPSGIPPDGPGYYKPEKIDFHGQNIIDICVGYSHILVLLSDGRVFGWGDNRKGPIGHIDQDWFISTPKEIVLEEKIKFIHCSKECSFAVSVDGNVYLWGDIGSIDSPTKIQIEDASKISHCAGSNNIIILDTFNKLFSYNVLKQELNEIRSEVEFTDLYRVRNKFCILQSDAGVYEFKDNNLIKTQSCNFFEYCQHESIHFEKTIEITKEGYLVIKEIVEGDHRLILKNKDIYERKFDTNFEETKDLGEGYFGTVSEVIDNSNNVLYAIKRIEIGGNKIDDKLDLKEITLMSNLNTDFVIQYIDSWIETKVVFGKMRCFLYIQMELCSQSLREFIELLKEISDEKFQAFDYFISCELFRELIECVNYLHSLDPPIIHRDLKPENILISDGINGRFLKLCDFGLAKFHVSEHTINEETPSYEAHSDQDSDNLRSASGSGIHTRMVGTINYMAPEVRVSNKYNMKSDVYSLALIATEIFRFEDNIKTIRSLKTRDDFDKYLSKYLNTNLEQKFRQLLETLSNCLLPEDYHSRPYCKQLLDSFNDFSVDKKFVSNDKNITIFTSFLTENINPLLKKVFEYKTINI